MSLKTNRKECILMPKIGISSYCLAGPLEKGEMDLLEVMQWAKDSGAEHVELVPIGYTLLDNEDLCRRVLEKSRELSLPLSNYAISADVLKRDPEERRAEIRRIQAHVDVAARLRIPLMRHDIASSARPRETNTPADFEKEFFMMVEAAAEVADYAARYGITTMVENHGFFVNGSDRIIRLVEAVNRPNFKMCLDTGNLLCMDEPPETSIWKCMPYAAMIHIKDFYVRKMEQLSGLNGPFDCKAEGWFESLGGRMLRGAVLGQGDIDTAAVVEAIRDGGYEGCVSLEFEGIEDSRRGTYTGLQTAKNLFAEN